MNNIKKILITISIFLLSFGQVANAGWEPSQEVEIVAHAKETSSTVAFARAVIKVIEEENGAMLTREKKQDLSIKVDDLQRKYPF